MKKIISVIVPVYNSEKYLERCVDSLLNQTYPHIEIVLVNDGSVDSSGNMCDSYSRTYPRIQTVHQENGGAAVARRNGVFHARGEYIAFVDADDWVEKDYLEQLVAGVEDTHADVAIGAIRNYNGVSYADSVSYFKPGFYDHATLQQEIYPRMLSASPYFSFGILPSMWGKLWKKTIVEKNLDALQIGITFGEDCCFTYSALLDCNSICITENSHYIYCLNEQSITHSFKKRLFEETPVLRNYLEKMAVKKNWQLGTQLDEYIGFVCGYVVRYAVMTANMEYRNVLVSLKDYVMQNFPNELTKSKTFAAASSRTKLRYYLVKNYCFSLLRGLMKINRVLHE